jgi:hypothetical protein
VTPEAKKKLYQQVSQPFPEEAVERTDGRVTGKGYSTTGIMAQFVINRLNEVLGIGGWRTHRKMSVRGLITNSGRKAYEAICDLVLELGEWIEGNFVPFGEALADGGHVSMSEADARKGGLSNALKKAAATFGAGRQADEGTIDDDNVPMCSPLPTCAVEGSGGRVKWKLGMLAAGWADFPLALGQVRGRIPPRIFGRADPQARFEKAGLGVRRPEWGLNPANPSGVRGTIRPPGAPEAPRD